MEISREWRNRDTGRHVADSMVGPVIEKAQGGKANEHNPLIGNLND